MTKTIKEFYDIAFLAMHNLIGENINLQDSYDYVWSLQDEARQLLDHIQDSIDREEMENKSK